MLRVIHPTVPLIQDLLAHTEGMPVLAPQMGVAIINSELSILSVGSARKYFYQNFWRTSLTPLQSH